MNDSKFPGRPGRERPPEYRPDGTPRKRRALDEWVEGSWYRTPSRTLHFLAPGSVFWIREGGLPSYACGLRGGDRDTLRPDGDGRRCKDCARDYADRAMRKLQGEDPGDDPAGWDTIPY